MNIFLRIGQSIENRREYVKALKRYVNLGRNYSSAMGSLVEASDQWRLNIGEDLISSMKFYDHQLSSSEILHEFYKTRFVPARLRFHTDKQKVEIFIGNPITVCEWEEGQFRLMGYSKRNPKDRYNWKTGAIVALENTTRINLTKDARKELFDAMFKKYPELKSNP